MLHSMWDLSSPTRDQNHVQWKFGILIPGPPGKSLGGLFRWDYTCTTEWKAAPFIRPHNPSPSFLKLFSGFLHWPENITDPPFNTQGLEGPLLNLQLSPLATLPLSLAKAASHIFFL